MLKFTLKASPNNFELALDITVNKILRNPDDPADDVNACNEPESRISRSETEIFVTYQHFQLPDQRNFSEGRPSPLNLIRQTKKAPAKTLNLNSNHPKMTKVTSKELSDSCHLTKTWSPRTKTLESRFKRSIPQHAQIGLVCY